MVRGGVQAPVPVMGSPRSTASGSAAGFAPAAPPPGKAQILIVPPRVEFVAAEPGATYRATVTLRNVDVKPRAVRIVGPAGKDFSLGDHPLTTRLAPGIDVSFTVLYRCAADASNASATDSFYVQAEDGRMDVPLQARPPAVELEFEPFLDFGGVILDRGATKTVLIHNRGGRAASITPVTEKGSPLRVTSPAMVSPGRAFNLPAASPAPSGSGSPGGRSTAVLEVKFTAPEVGPFSGFIDLRVAGSDAVHRIEVRANTVEQKLQLYEPGAKAPILPAGLALGTLFYGASRSTTLELHNNGPLPSQFTCRVSAVTTPQLGAPLGVSDEASSSSVGADAGGANLSAFTVGLKMKKWRDKVAKAVFIEPATGLLPPYGTAVLTLTYAPQQPDPTSGFAAHSPAELEATDYDYAAVVTMQGSKTKLSVPIRARGIAPQLSLSASKFDFGDAPTNAVVATPVVVTNNNAELPVAFVFVRGSVFKASPATGVLSPGQSTTVDMLFAPKALGHFNETMLLRACPPNSSAVSQEAVIAVRGTASAVGAKPPPRSLEATAAVSAGETRQLALTLRVPTESLRPGLGAVTLPRAPRAKAFLASEDVTRRFEEVLHSKHALTLEEAHSKEAHRERYTAYIKGSYDARVAQLLGVTPKQRAAHAVDPVSLGLSHASGLVPPRLALPPVTEPLFLHKRDPNAQARPRVRPMYAKEEAMLEQSKPFKAEPTTELEMRECAATLTSLDIGKLLMGPAVVDFGTVPAASNNVRLFAITNEMRSCVRAQLIARDKELSATGPLSQVIPPSGTAVFYVRLTVPTVTQGFKRSIMFNINGVHSYFFDVTAEVIPATLSVSKDEINFTFGQDQWDPYLEQVIKVTNPNPSAAEYHWESTSPAFTVHPPGGSVDRKSQVDTMIRWQPAAGQANEGVLSLRVVGGGVKKMHVRGELPESKCAFRDKSLEFGIVSVGAPKSVELTFRNLGQGDAVFMLEPPPGGWGPIRASPLQGKIVGGMSKDLTVTFDPASPMTYETPLTVAIRGGKAIKLPVHAEAVLPAVSIDQDELSFEAVYQGASGALPVTLRNVSIATAQLALDLRGPGMCDFVLELLKDSWSPADYPDSDTGAGPLTCDGGLYTIAVAPSKSLAFSLVFRPTAVAQHAFELPLTLQGVPPAASALLRRPVVAEGLRPRLLLSAAAATFGSRIILGERVKKIPYTMDLTLHNNDPTELRWQLANPPDSTKGAFGFVPSSGVVPVGDTVVIRVTFLPRVPVVYECSVPLYLDGQKDKAYMHIELKGKGRYPHLEFSEKEVVIPPVPLGTRSHARFYILNRGYDNLELRYRLPPDVAHAPVKLHFPEGCILGIAKETLPVEVSFSSDTATAFTTAVDFLDEDGNRFSVPVTGTADNSLLTSYPFIKARREEITLLAEDNLPVRLAAKDYPPLSPAAAAAVPVLSPNLARWLNATTSKGPFDDLPAACLATKGRLVIELTEFLSGKQLPGKQAAVANKKEQLDAFLAQYDRLLTFLRSAGALLNDVKPEYLLDLDEFQRVLAAREQKLIETTGGEAGAPAAEIALWRAAEAGFARIQAAAWTTVLLQIVKVFVLGRLTVRQFRALPCLEATLMPAASDPSFAASNLYSLPETLLLKWLSLHFKRTLPIQAVRITNFDVDLRNGLALYAVLVSHWPSLERFVKDLKKAPKRDPEFADNAAVIVAMLAELALPFSMTAKELVNPDPREMLLFVLYLYQTLPQLVPRAEIEFAGDLNVTLAKAIELSNPSSKPISYAVRLEGSKDFAIGDPVVRIEPKSTVLYPVECTPSQTNVSEARVAFLSRRDMGTSFAATLVFALRTNIDVNKPRMSLKVETPAYELLQVPLKIETPFTADGEFHVKLRHEFVPADTRRLSVGERPRWPDAIAVDRKVAKIKKGGAADFVLSFLPFQAGAYRTTIVLEDDKLGAFCVEIVADGKLPLPLPLAQFRCDNKGSHTRDLTLPFYNDRFEIAKRYYMERHPGSKVKEQADLFKAALAAAGDVTGAGLVYQVISQSTLIACPATLTLRDVGGKKGGGPGKSSKGAPVLMAESSVASPSAAPPPPPADAAGGPANVLLVTLTPRGPGIYPGHIVLASQLDTRVVEVEFTALPTVQRVTLDFECLAGQKILQNIPLVNTSDKSLSMKAVVVGDQVFSGPREMTVSAGGTSQYALAYAPAWAGTHTAELQLTVAATNETSVYLLKGVCEEPLASGAVAVECPARQRQAVKLLVPNVKERGATVYDVQTDLACVSGNPMHKVDGQQSSYELNIMPFRGGDTKGTVTFTADDGRFAWFMVDVKVASPPAESSFSLAAVVRTAVTAQLALTNPLDAAIEFEVKIFGDGLLGPRTLTAGPRQSVTYDLVFSPLAAGKWAGSLHFVSDRVGEFWYALDCDATAAEVVTLPRATCPVGGRAVVMFEVENPLGEEVTLVALSSNPRNFALPPTVLLPPFGTARVPLEYVASSLGDVEEATLSLSHPAAGTWAFACSGVGIAPAEMAPTAVTATLGSQASFVVDYSNPFSGAIAVAVRLEAPGGGPSPPGFALLLKRKTEKVGGFEALQIPLTFTPETLAANQACAVVVEYEPPGAQRVTWTYPVVGTAEATATLGRSIKLACQARSAVEETLDVSLLPAGDDPEPFTYRVVVRDGPSSATLAQALTVEAEAGEAGQVTRPDGTATFRVRLAPRRAMAGTADLLVQRASGGRWRFEIAADCSEPDMDGSIRVESWVKETGSSQLTVRTGAPTAVAFRAYFSADSPAEFGVEPSHGVMEANEDFVFNVTFSPETYGAGLEGKLVIVTDAEEWRYMVLGAPPRYERPRAESRVDARLGPEVAEAWEMGRSRNLSRNFVRDNIAHTMGASGKR